MNISEYVKGLKGVINKDDVLSTLSGVVQDLNSKVQPIVDTSEAAFKTMKLKSSTAIGYEERYRDHFKLGRNTHVFTDLQNRLHVVNKNLDFMRDTISKTLPETVASSNIDHRSAALLQLIDNSAFMMRFIRRYVESVVVFETEAIEMYEDYQKNNLTKGEVLWIENRFAPFLMVLESLSEDPNSFRKKFDTIPHVKVDINSHDDFALFGRLKLDPFKMSFIPVYLNPFFIAGKWIAEFQAWRYHEAQEDLIRVQRRILLLEEAIGGKSNIKLEKEIEILRSKAAGLTYKINKAEEDL